ncbi:MAG: HAD-IA family hydrolase [Flavobacteriaceae bacterium]|nr:HAD-IA family hydrolase [Flavobacteriaceae bacterium]
MIKNIIFDLGDIFIDLDHEKSKNELLNLGISQFTDEMIQINGSYEKGLISTLKFLEYYKIVFSNISEKQLVDSWNSILMDFPKHRLSFLEAISSKYRLFLLSNTNELHIDYFKAQVGYDFYRRFESSFEKIYYSHEINYRKPEKEAFQMIVVENNLEFSETLFVDDQLQNIESAKKLGIHTWHLNPDKEEVVELFTVKGDLFGQEAVKVV